MTPENPTHMRLYATGNNAWNQLDFSSASCDYNAANSITSEPADLHAFTPIVGPEIQLALIAAKVSYTLVHNASQLLLAGVPPDGPQSSKPLSADLTPLAAVCDEGRHFNLFDPAQAPITLGDICAPHPVPLGHRLVKQIEAYDAGIIMLLDDASVWVYGDSRYPDCLSNPEDTSPNPGVAVTKTRTLQHVSSLDGLPTGPITKVAAGAYTLAGLTEGGDVYVWGGRPSHRSPIEDVCSEPVPLDVDFDVSDIAMGKQHMIVLTTDGLVYGKGCNRSGQLGCLLGDKHAVGHWVTEWAELEVNVQSDETAKQVYAAAQASFVLTASLLG